MTLPMLFVFGPDGILPLLSPRLSLASPVVMPFFAPFGVSGPTLLWDDGPGAVWPCCAMAPADESARKQAEASRIFFIVVSLKFLKRLWFGHNY
jgi:hypothetical protein